MTHYRGHFRVVSWNIRAGGGTRAQSIFDQLVDWRADVVGLCEFRGTPPSQELAAALRQAGYAYQISSTDPLNPARNALLLASKTPLRRTRLQGMPVNSERWILARTQLAPKLALGMMHVPNYTSPHLKYPFLDAVVNISRRWRSGPALLMGDTNCGKKLIDEEKPMAANFKREHDFMVNMETRKWCDAFRYLHGDRREYTWYSHRNNGFRLDHAFCTHSLKTSLVSVRHVWGINPGQPDRREGLSDHAALILDFKFPGRSGERSYTVAG